MQPNKRVYLDLAKRLATSTSIGVHLPIEFRDKVRTTLLRYAINCVDCTSAYICRYDFDEKSSIVRNEYVHYWAPGEEHVSDLDVKYSEDEIVHIISWLSADSPQPLHAIVDKLNEADPLRNEIVQYGATNVLYLPIYYESKIWGYMEFWEFRENHLFSEDEIATIQEFSSCVEKTIVIIDG